MEKITFEDFYNRYSVKRNPINSTSNYENTMLDMDDDEELEEVENSKPTKVWTLTEDKSERFILKPGLIYNTDVIGYFICNNEWKDKKENFILI